MPRNIVVCCDGTGNEYGSANSNVVKLYWTLSAENKQIGYWKMVLPRMGLKERGNSEWGAGQWASFFCLENKYWRIIALDTGYNSTRFDWGKVPVLQRSKWLRKTTGFKPGCNIPEALFAWLKSSVNPDGDKRGLIVLSYHGPHSAFEAWYQIPAQQLAKVIHRPVIWFWGHEHRLAIYEKFSVKEGIA